MVEPKDEVLEEAVHEGEAMDWMDLFDLVERSHDERAGVPLDVVEAYAEELASRRDYSFDAAGFLGALEDRLTDAETWQGPDRIYPLGEDRVSRYPARWHDRLGGSTDAGAYVRFLADEDPAFGEADHPGTGGTVPEDRLVDVIRVVGRTDRETATAAIGWARDSGAVVEDADQHPHAGVYVPGEDEDIG